MGFIRFLPVLAIFSALCGGAFGAVEPTLAVKQGLWTLDMSFEHPQELITRVPGEGVKTFWYVIMTVTNNTGKEVEFYPSAELTTDTLNSYPASQGLRRSVVRAIKRRHRERYPFLESFESVDNTVLQGQDNAKDIAIVFPDFDPNAKTVKIYVAGLSNETAMIDHPTAKDPNGNPVPVILRKSLELEYATGGQGRELAFVGKKWVMR